MKGPDWSYFFSCLFLCRFCFQIQNFLKCLDTQNSSFLSYLQFPSPYRYMEGHETSHNNRGGASHLLYYLSPPLFVSLSVSCGDGDWTVMPPLCSVTKWRLLPYFVTDLFFSLVCQFLISFVTSLSFSLFVSIGIHPSLLPSLLFTWFIFLVCKKVSQNQSKAGEDRAAASEKTEQRRRGRQSSGDSSGVGDGTEAGLVDGVG